MKKFAGALILLIVGALLSCPKPTGSTSPSKVWMVSTLAGGTSAEFNWPYGVAVDSSGNVYVGDTSNHRIRKITLGESGVSVSTFAGGSTSGSADGRGTSARFNSPHGLAVDSSGNVYVADTRNHRIRKISTNNGQVDTLAGGGTPAEFSFPKDVAVDASGNVYVADENNNRIRKITPERAVSTLAGDGTGGSRDGAGTSAQFSLPNGVAVDASGNVYVADWQNHRIRKITPAEGRGESTVSTLAGDGTGGFRDGAGTDAQFKYPNDVAVDAEGNVYVADQFNHRIRKITPEGVVSTLAGSGTTDKGIPGGGFKDGVGRSARFYSPTGVAVDAEGNLYVADRTNNRIRKIEYKLP